MNRPHDEDLGAHAGVFAFVDLVGFCTAVRSDSCQQRPQRTLRPDEGPPRSLVALVPWLVIAGCGFDWSLPTPPEGGAGGVGASTNGPSTSASTSGTGGHPSSTGGGPSTSSPSSTTPTTTTTGGGGAGGAELDPCVKCADNFVSSCCDTAACDAELAEALADPSHVIDWKADVACYDYDFAMACAACNDLCIFQCQDYFPNQYCFDDTWCD